MTDEKRQLAFTGGEFVRLTEVMAEIGNNHKDDDLGLCLLEKSEADDETIIITLFEYDEDLQIGGGHEFEGQRYGDKPLVRYRAWLPGTSPIERVDLRADRLNRSNEC